ncbi:MAG: Multi antimicrobial extrusion protein (Na(+)/drug antiporter), MATE family of MDR efflux pumps [uncultured Pyrinomonadaceae bacterium]|uniref:Multi antimicrobial extrusion protein (Na(+)/drug antiporter), MATE family of MDR efflux pumps n=1 Tax=uncultured Pyrinomonadaceae bacterium TaxID=2283094 RepID=A0A6J4PS95_9BACT|nr:MAG: Multi antimicrobial extrusion protein (Na(+)/drug antiporter), MATE family of MDR efflux pumps [uncultured Pyrinomonadaceae bacterium]
MKKSLKFILLFLFAVFIFWFFGRNLDWQEISQSLRRANAFYLILAVLIISFGYLLRAIRWKTLLAPITETYLKELFATTTVGYAAVFLVGRIGEIVRPMWLPMRDRRVRPSAALITIGVERIFDLAALICFFAVNFIWFKSPAGHEAEFDYVKLIGNLMLVGVAVGFIALYVYQKYAAQFIEWFERATDRKFFPKRIQKIFLSLLRQLTKSLRVLKDWREVTAVVFWTILLWFSIAVPTWLVILAFDLPLNFSDSLFVMGWAALGSLVPTPGGAAGAFHAATAGGLIFLNIDPNDAAATSIAMHLVYFAPAVFFGLYYFLHGDMSVARFKSLLDSEHAVEEIEEGDRSDAETERRGDAEQKTEDRRPKTEDQIANRKSQIANPKSL